MAGRGVAGRGVAGRGKAGQGLARQGLSIMAMDSKARNRVEAEMFVKITIEGAQPLLMHQDNVGWSEKVKAWQKDPENKKYSVAGDDRSPAWTWIGALYHDDEIVTIPSDNIMTMLREGGAQVPVPGAKGSKTFKAQTQSGLLPIDADWELYGPDGNTIPVKELLALEHANDFDDHVKVVHQHGFDLLVKRAKIGTSKHIRVRPIFRAWSAAGRIEIIDEQITADILQSILTFSGRLKGIGDWRPSSKTPGRFGTFSASVEVIPPPEKE